MQYLFTLLLFQITTLVCGIYEWSFQQRIKVPGSGTTYGTMPPALFGRGFLTLVTGYNDSAPGIFVHTTDEGYVRNGQYVWSQQAVLVASDVSPGDEFGKWMVSSNHTLIVSAPAHSSSRGYAYIFNGTLRHWSQIQRLAAFEGVPNDRFGEQMTLYENTLVIGSKGSLTTVNEKTSGGIILTHTLNGAAYIFGRDPGGLYWSRQGKLVPDYLLEVSSLQPCPINCFYSTLI
jgi:hypothetical protein